MNHENSLEREIQRFAFRRPIVEVWPELITVLGERGYTVRETVPVEDRTVISELRPETGFETAGYRVLIRVNRVDRARYKIRLELQFTGDDGVVSMDLRTCSGAPRRS